MMRHLFLIFLLLVNFVLSGQAQHAKPEENVVFTLGKKKGISVQTTAKGTLEVNLSQKDIDKIKKRGHILYSDFGAKADGDTDDIDAIVATHALANRENLSVKADKNARYYIGGKARTAIIQTDTDFGSAEFIIDDTDVEDRTVNVFAVTSTLEPFQIKGISSLKKNQKKIEVPLPGPVLITATNDQVSRYIRFGPNQNNGSPQTDIFMVDKDGNIDMKAPIVWDFDQITEITALPIDQQTLTLKGGKFTTIANQAESKYNYYGRGIAIRRSNVVVDGLEHHVTGEGEQGAPYSGFLAIRDCSHITVRNSILTGRKTYRTIGSAGVPVSMGSYDISISRALNVTFEYCSQTNDINDATYWGIMGSNYCKNLVLDHCSFSRFDAHMGVANATIRNSELGHMGVNAIGTGTFLIENSILNGRNLINLRPDYGSTWEGEFIIRNSKFIPAGGRTVTPILFGGSNAGQHDFGYITYMPERIVLENLHIDDSNSPKNYDGPAIFANFNPDMTDDTYQEAYPHIRPREVRLVNVKTTSGKPLRISENPYPFKDVKIITD
jgi:hypothetical protein